MKEQVLARHRPRTKPTTEGGPVTITTAIHEPRRKKALISDITKQLNQDIIEHKHHLSQKNLPPLARVGGGQFDLQGEALSIARVTKTIPLRAE